MAMNSYDKSNETMYSVLMMTPPPEKVDFPPPEGSSLPTRQISTPDDPPTPDSLPKTTPSNHQSSISSGRTRLDCRRQSTASDLIFSPRGYQELYTERAYLSSALQTQSLRATGLIRQYSSLEEELQSIDTPKQRRRLRKQLSLLRCRLNDAGNQERALLIRMSEICVELQSHETWHQARQERILGQQEIVSPAAAPSCFSCFSPSPTSHTPGEPSLFSETCLNGATPSFVPREISMGTVGSHRLTGLEAVDEVGEDFQCNHGLEYEYRHEEEMCKVGGHRRFSLDGELTPPREKRLSLPNLQSVWP